MDAQRWLGNMLGANAWGSSFFVGEGTTFPNCIQHQVANLAGSLNGTGGRDTGAVGRGGGGAEPGAELGAGRRDDCVSGERRGYVCAV